MGSLLTFLFPLDGVVGLGEGEFLRDETFFF